MTRAGFFLTVFLSQLDLTAAGGADSSQLLLPAGHARSCPLQPPSQARQLPERCLRPAPAAGTPPRCCGRSPNACPASRLRAAVSGKVSGGFQGSSGTARPGCGPPGRGSPPASAGTAEARGFFPKWDSTTFLSSHAPGAEFSGKEIPQNEDFDSFWRALQLWGKVVRCKFTLPVHDCSPRP